MRSFMVGADPEVFVGNQFSVKSIIGTIGGTKARPRPLPLGPGFAVQEDNVALEFNIPASASKAEFTDNISSAMGFLEQVMKDRYQLQFVKESAVSFPSDELIDPASWIFGCDPDYNAWTHAQNSKPSAKDPNLRSCGGHVHVGISASKNDKARLIRIMDLVQGVPSVLMDEGTLRKQLYGKAGAFRFKPYGVEYRTLSNFWVFKQPYVEWIYDTTERAVSMMEEGFDAIVDKDAILTAINDNDKPVADYLVAKYNLVCA